MPPPSRISADDLVAWSGSATASSTLPVSVRRLVHSEVATGVVEFRGDAGVTLSGIDGRVVVGAATNHVATGESVWELSTEGGVGAKVQSDYAKRSKATPASSRKRLSYVAVTSRRWAGKTKWQKKKKGWASVRILDADDLATWLEEATAVAAWFAIELQRPSVGVFSVSRLVREVLGRTAPALRPESVSAGRDAAVQAVTTWAAGPPSLLRLQAESREEAALLAAAVLAREVTFESRALVVENREVLDWALASVRPSLVVASIDGFYHGGLGLSNHLLLACGPGFAGSTVGVVGGLQRDPLRQALSPVVGPAVAARYAARCGGSVIVLQRLMGLGVRPQYAQESLSPPRRAMLLAGSWVPACEGDQQVIAALAGERGAGDVDADCARLATVDGAPIRRRDDTWVWRAPEDAWRLFFGGLTERQLVPFWSAVTTVLGELDPLMALSDRELAVAAFSGAGRRYSSYLRSGLAGSLVRVAALPQRPGPGPQASNVGATIRGLLREGWQHWGSLRDELPTLAEAAPDVFLDQLFLSLRSGDAGVAHLFALRDSFWGPTPHVGLMWALERLAWQPARLSRVARALAELHARDPGGQNSQRPLRSLGAIFRDVWPQTLATNFERLRVLQELVQHAPSVATWDLLIVLLPDRVRAGGIDTGSHPEHLEPPIDPSPPGTVTTDPDYWRGLSQLVCQAAAADPVRWSRLLDELSTAPGFFIFEALRVANQQVAVLSAPATRETVWSAARHLLRALRNAAHQNPPTNFDANIVAEAERLELNLRSQDQVRAIAWLFEYRPQLAEDLGHDWRRESERVEIVRAEALASVVQSRGEAAVRELIAVVPRPEVLGGALAQHADAASGRFDDVVLAEEVGPQPLRAAFLRAFVPVRTEQAGHEWLRQRLSALVGAGRVEDAVAASSGFNPTGALWDSLESVGASLVSAYWSAGPRLLRGLSGAELERGVRALLGGGQVAAALEATSMSSPTTRRGSRTPMRWKFWSAA